MPRKTQSSTLFPSLLALSLVLSLTSAVHAVGAGPLFNLPGSIALEADGQIVVTDDDRILRVDPVTGDRSIVSDNNTGLGQPFGLLTGIAVEADGQIVVVDRLLPGVLRVDPMTGHRTVITAPSLGSGVTLGYVEEIAVEPSGTLIIADSVVSGRIVRIDPTTGNRTVVSDGLYGIGNGPMWTTYLTGLVVDNGGNIIATSAGPGPLATHFQVDPVTGNRSIVVTGQAPLFQTAYWIALATSGSIYTIHSEGRISHYDPATGNQILVSARDVGSGVSLSGPRSIAVDSGGDIIVSDALRKSLFRVDPATGDRTLISSTDSIYSEWCSGPITPVAEGEYDFDATTPTGPIWTACGFSGTGVWFYYIASITGYVSITADGSGYFSYLGVHQGRCGSQSSVVACEGPAMAASVTLFVEAGRSYQIAVQHDHPGGIPSPGHLSIRPQAVRDECVDAPVVTAGSTPFTTNGATNSIGAVATSTCTGAGVFDNDAWAEYVATETGPLLVSLCGADFDTELAIYEGDCGALTDLACNDNSCETSSGGSFASQLLTSVVAGDSYKIRIGGVAGAAGVGTLTITPLTSNCQVTKAIPAGAAAGDHNGVSVAIDGEFAVAGAYKDNDQAVDGGAAYVYRWNGTDWAEHQQLLANDGLAYDFFGLAVDLEGDLLVVGAPGHDTGGVSFAGAAYVFRRSGFVWHQEAKLTPTLPSEDYSFGISVAIDGSRIVIGATHGDGAVADSGAVHVYSHVSGSWVEEQKLTASDAAPDDRFGVSVAVDGNIIVVGADSENDLGDKSGAAYIFRSISGVWVQEQKLTASDGATLDMFGNSVATDGGVILVGAHQQSAAGTSAGAAYLFRDNGSTWLEEQKLLATDTSAYDHFGFDVTIVGNQAVVGANAAHVGGAAYVFEHDGTTWAQSSFMVPTDGAPGDNFGYAVGFDGNSLVVGAYRDDDLGTDTGAVYFFATETTEPPTLTCHLFQHDSVTEAYLSWGQGGPYTGFDVELNGQLIASLSGTLHGHGIYPTTPGSYEFSVTAYDACGTPLPPVSCTLEVSSRFVRGDCNDNGSVNLTDAIALMSLLFSGGSTTCVDACDANGNGNMNLADVVHLLSFLFSGGVEPAAPFPLCGRDQQLGCDTYSSCP